MQLSQAKTTAFTPFYLLSVLGVIIYAMLSTASIYMPPLIGVFFTYLVISKSDAERSLSGLAGYWYLAFGFLIFAEQVNGFAFLSSVVIFVAFYYVVHDWLIINIKSRFFMFIMFSASAYIGMFLASNLFLYIFDGELLKYSNMLLYYVIVESVFNFWFFKESKL